MTEVEEDAFVFSMPLPAQQYTYEFILTYEDGTAVAVDDPVNHSPTTVDGSKNVHYSYVYVGTSADAPAGMENLYPVEDESYAGTVVYDTVTASSGITQNLEIYLPYDYNSSKTYKVLYVSHGSGGNEHEWLSIGSLKNIMDNLAEQGVLTDTLVVSMDNNTTFNNMSDLEAVARNTKATGYQIQYSTSSSFSSSTTKTVTVKGNKNVTTTLKNLTKGKKYYIRMRAYKTSGSVTSYAGWSKVKTVTVKK